MRGPLRPPPTTAPASPPASGPDSPAPGPLTPPPASASLIRLDRAFDVDEFSQLLGETTVRIRVPREDLMEVLRRVTEFMGFGVYVYSFQVRPAASASLKEFEVELQRIDFRTETNRWEPFVERGSTDSPYGDPPGTT